MSLSIDKRWLIVSERLSGKNLLEISKEQHISYSTVKRIWSRYKKEGEKGLKPSYENCGRTGSRYAKFYDLAITLKQENPSWGSPYILTILSKEYPNENLPKVRALQNWFSRLNLNKPKLERPQQVALEIQHVHDCWQIDAKENIKLSDGNKYCYLTTVDVKSGIALEAPVFSLWKNQSSSSKTNTSLFAKLFF